MKRILSLLCIGIMFLGMYSCSESGNGQPTIADLQKEINDLKKQLEQNTKIKAVAFEGSEMILTFQDGSTFRSPVPSSVIPTIGENGNWWVNDEDLGIKAVAQIPVIGENGNWWVDGKDSGKPAQGGKGDKGDTGNGIAKVEYDETTGILKITLTDNTYYEFTLGVSGDGGNNLGGNKIEDLNGAFLLSKVINGDFTFADFTYDNQNNMTGISYYENLLNAPVKKFTLKRDFNTEKKIIRQTLTEYATKNMCVKSENYTQDYEYLDDQYGYIQMTPAQIFDELFPQGISGYTASKEAAVKTMLYADFCDNDYVYFLKSENNNFYLKKNRRANGYSDQSSMYMLKKENNKYYFLISGYYAEGYWYASTDQKHFTHLSSARPTGNTNSPTITFDNNLVTSNYYKYSRKFEAIKYTGTEDEKNGNTIIDYYTPSADKTWNLTGEAGKFKFPMFKYTLYSTGSTIQNLTFNYIYNGNDYTIEDNSGEQYYVEMNGNKIRTIGVFENGQTKTPVLSFNYNTDGNISVIDVPYEGVKSVAQFIYDSRKNPVEFSVNSSVLAGKGYDNLFCTLGLAYRYQEFDETLGRLVEKVKYTDKFTPILKIKYNYGLKNFMNHTFTAMNPLLEGFKMNNAISEMIWAGHGSYFMAEYSDYNEGGYPTRLKGLLQLSDEILTDDPDLNLPLNVSVATLYKLEYQKKK